jgi:hypothetical protein
MDGLTLFGLVAVTAIGRGATRQSRGESCPKRSHSPPSSREDAVPTQVGGMSLGRGAAGDLRRREASCGSMLRDPASSGRAAPAP